TAEYADGSFAPSIGSQADIRVVWIIFDEWSQAITFGDRPAGLDLPNFDRLRAESFYATAAKTPCGFTLIFIPRLLLGEQADSFPAGPKSLVVQLESRRAPASWSTFPNVFDQARKMGFDTALAGWFHPYGRLLSGSLTRCYWIPEQLPPGIEERFE